MPKRQMVMVALVVSVVLMVLFAATEKVTLSMVGVAISAYVVGCLTTCLMAKPRPRSRDRAERVDRVADLLTASNANLERATARLVQMKQQRMDA